MKKHIGIEKETLLDGVVMGNDMADLIRSFGDEFTHVVVTDNDSHQVFEVEELAQKLENG